jgi:hypothetical protein
MKQYKFVSIDGNNPNNEIYIKKECFSLDLLVETFKDFLKANGFDDSKINTAINNVFRSTQPTISTIYTYTPGTLTKTPNSVGEIQSGNVNTMTSSYPYSTITPLTKEQIGKLVDMNTMASSHPYSTITPLSKEKIETMTLTKEQIEKMNESLQPVKI